MARSSIASSQHADLAGSEVQREAIAQIRACCELLWCSAPGLITAVSTDVRLDGLDGERALILAARRLARAYRLETNIRLATPGIVVRFNRRASR